jgi:flagellar biogenesis protein FliO
MDLAFQMVAVLAVLAAMGGGLWALNRRRPPTALEAGLQLEGRVALTPNHSLHLVRFRGAPMLVATHPGGCSIMPLPENPPLEENPKETR